MKRKILMIMLVLCLFAGCGKKDEGKNLENTNHVINQSGQELPDDSLSNDEDKNVLNSSDTLEQIEQAKISAAKNTFYAMENVVQNFYVMELMMDTNFKTTTFVCNGVECSNGIKALDVQGKVPSSGEITVNEDGTVLFSNIVIDGYKCNVLDSGEITCSK